MSAPVELRAAPLGHVEAVELIDTGSWVAASGPFNPSPDDLASAVGALACPAVRRPVLKLGHTGEHSQGDPALGYVANLRTANEGNTLVGDFRGMPHWLTAVDDQGDSVLASAYPDRSIEGEYGYRCQIGHTHPFVVHAVALLGVERPAVGTLQSLQELYGVTAKVRASEGGQLVTLVQVKETPVPQLVAAQVSDDDIIRAFYAGPGQNWDVWVRDHLLDGQPRLIVDNDADGSIWAYPYTIAADQTVTFDAPTRVFLNYTTAPVAASAATQERPAITRARSRDLRPAAATETPPAEPAAGPTHQQEESTMGDTLSEGLRQRLGITDADANDEVILSALDEALNERAEPPAQQPVAASVPAGMQLIDSSTLESLRTDAAAGRQAREQQLVEHRNRVVDAGITAGKFAPARRDHFLELMRIDPAGTEAIIASLAPDLVPVTAKGHDGGEPTTLTDPAAGDNYWFPGVTTTSREG